MLRYFCIVENKIFITGQIGSSLDENGNVIKGVDLLDVITQVQDYGPENRDLTVVIKSPGGYVEVGDAIYNYLEGLKSKGYKIKTVGDTLVGSIATKIFLVGEERELLEGTEFFIHNPAVNPGLSDANKLAAFAERVAQVEDNLRKFYAEKTGTDEDVLKPLMDVETSMTPNQAMSLGFATIITEDFKILAKVKMNLKDLVKNVKAFASIKAMVELQLADGKKVVIEAEPGQEVGASVTVEGAPAPVGEHTLSDGKILVVTEAGKVAQIKEAAAPSEDEDEVSKMKKDIQMLTEAVQTLKGAQAKAQVETTEAITKSLQEEITALKAEIKTGHRPSTKTLDPLKAVKNDPTITTQELVALRSSGNIELYKEKYFKKYGVQVEL